MYTKYQYRESQFDVKPKRPYNPYLCKRCQQRPIKHEYLYCGRCGNKLYWFRMIIFVVLSIPASIFARLSTDFGKPDTALLGLLFLILAFVVPVSIYKSLKYLFFTRLEKRNEEGRQ